MLRYGYKLMSEEHPPKVLIGNACLAEDAGFDFVAISDHLQPWLDEQGHAPFAWSVLGAIAVATERVGIMTAATCPFLRYHPAIIAQAAATTAIMSGDRFTLGLGAGEALNERAAGRGWPGVATRHEMLREAVSIIEGLWSGERTSYEGRHLRLENARLYDVPDLPPPIAIAAGGPEAAQLAGERADALVATEAKSELVEAYRGHGGDGPRYAELSLCWAPDEGSGLATVRERFRWCRLGWKVLPELAEPAAFDAATQLLEPADFRDTVPCGPDPDRYVGAVRRYRDAGFDHVILTQVGPDQAGFLRFWEHELAPALRAMS